jgi:glycosyltransferase involved in cell wall biosynthesis
VTVLYNTNYTHNPNAYLTLAIQRAAEALFGGDNVVLADNRTLVSLAAAGEHATLICIDGQRLNRKLIERVRPSFRTMVLWLFEDPFMLEYNRASADLFDFVFTNEPTCVGSYMGKGHYLPLGASRTLHLRPVAADEALDYDIFFAGTMWPNRVRPLRALLKRFPDKRFKLVCPTNMYLPPLPRDIAARAIQWPISHESFVDFANSSRVTLTMFRDYASHSKNGRATAPGPRLFELALAGTAQVVQVDPAVPADNFPLIDGVVCCDSLGTLLTEVKGLLADPQQRQARAAASQRAVNKTHLFENRLQAIAAITGAEFRRLAFAAAAPASGGRRLRVLMCTHSTMREPDWGGVEVYQQALVTALVADVEVFFWIRRETTCTLMQSDGTILEQFSMPEIGWLDTLTDAREETVFANVIPQYAIDVVHFQHLGHHAASLPIIAKSCGAGTVLSAHDFFMVCSRYNLLDYNPVFCDIGNRTITACDNCLQVCEGVPPGGQETRRAFMAEMLRSVDVLLFGTAYSEQLCLRIYPELVDKRRAVLGIPTPTGVSAPPSPRPLRAPAAPLKVAVVGNFLRSKGADTVLSVIEMVDPSLFAFHLFGKADPQYEEVFRRKDPANLFYRGRHNAGELDALAECDVSLHLSIWPETFCISLSEAWQRGVVPIVSDIGALADRVTHGENGFVVNVNDAAAVIGYLEPDRAGTVGRQRCLRQGRARRLSRGRATHRARRRGARVRRRSASSSAACKLARSGAVPPHIRPVAQFGHRPRPACRDHELDSRQRFRRLHRQRRGQCDRPYRNPIIRAIRPLRGHRLDLRAADGHIGSGRRRPGGRGRGDHDLPEDHPPDPPRHIGRLPRCAAAGRLHDALHAAWQVVRRPIQDRHDQPVRRPRRLQPDPDRPAAGRRQGGGRLAATERRRRGSGKLSPGGRLRRHGVPAAGLCPAARQDRRGTVPAAALQFRRIRLRQHANRALGRRHFAKPHPVPARLGVPVGGSDAAGRTLCRARQSARRPSGDLADPAPSPPRCAENV